MLKDGPPLPNVKEKRVVRVVSEFEKIIAVRLSLGAFITDRENVVSIKRMPQEDGSMIL